jgi:vancomycin resistance protein YoaR
MILTTRQEYEKEINRIQGLINNAREKQNYYKNKQNSDMQSRCAGMDNWCGGITCCERWKINATKANNEDISKWKGTEERHKEELWNYQKRIAQEEQDAQIEAVKRAIAEQVKAEQEKIKAQQLAEQQQEQLIETVEIKNPVAQVQQEIIQPQANNQNLILPLAVVAGVLLL